MTPEQFLGELDEAVKARLASIERAAKANAPAPQVSIADLLTVALKNELEAADEAAAWLITETDVEVKLALARQCGDEAKHYRLIAERLRELGVDPAAVAPKREAYSPLYALLQGLSSTGERLAAGQFTREALAQVRNQAFIEHCEAMGDAATARLYREVIQPDEAHHHALGRALLPRFAVTAEQQEKARAAALKTLELASELAELARLKKGIARAPGC